MNCDSILAEKCYRGEALADELVVDVHAHLGPWLTFPVVDEGSAESLLQQMELGGIEWSVLSPQLASGPDWREGNHQAYEARRRHPTRLLSYFTPNPNYPWEAMVAEIERWRGEEVLTGFKLHPSLHGYACTDARCYPIYEYANEHKLPILSHEWKGEKVEGQHPLRGLAQRYANVTFINAHSASNWEDPQGWAQRQSILTAAAAGQDNIYLDLCGSALYYGILEAMVSSVGAEHVLFGTDMPFLDGRAQVGRILTARLSDDEKRLIMGQNAARVFSLPPQ